MDRLHTRCFVPVSLLAALVLSPARCLSDDWPTYRHDSARSGITAEQLETPLKSCWVRTMRHKPDPAWEAPRSVPVEGILELGRVQFDDAFQPILVGDAAYFGSSADGKVYCLDVATGSIRWTKRSEGPIRLAPAITNGKLYVGSDDGHAYCLDATSGRELWKQRIGPDARKLLGNGKMISCWPLRTGVLVDGDIAYCGAGIWPAEGVYLQAMNAADGRLVWRNDTIGESTETRLSPQGYMLATKDLLFVPQGRVPPAAFRRKDGAYTYSVTFGKNIGGTYALIADGILYTGTEELISYDQATRERFAWFEARQAIVAPEATYAANDSDIVCVDRNTYSQPSLRRFSLRDQRNRLRNEIAVARRTHDQLKRTVDAAKANLDAVDKQTQALNEQGKAEDAAGLGAKRAALQKALDAETAKYEDAAAQLAGLRERETQMEQQWNQAGKGMQAGVKWSTPQSCPDALILAGTTVFAGGDGQVVALDSATGKILWKAPVNGKAKGLAVGSGRLLVSTDQGAIHCFGPQAAPASGELTDAAAPAQSNEADRYATAAEVIVRESGVTRGYCLVVGNASGHLALELARRTELTICATDPDPEQVEAAKDLLDAAGMYGARVTVECAPPEQLPYSGHFANLIVSERALSGALDTCNGPELRRLLKPCGGVLMVGQTDTAASALSADSLQAWLQTLDVPGGKVDATNGMWAKLTRGALPGAGEWTHEYADAGNTTCSYDYIVKCPLKLLWYGRPGPLHMISRHRRAASPLTVNGILFVQGEHQVMAYDAYNGLPLWEREVRNVVRATVSHDCSNLAADSESFFVATQQKCLRLAAASGETLKTYTLPEPNENRRWGYVARIDDVLLGSRTAGSRDCDAVFATDLKSGKALWTHTGKRIHHPSISADGGRVFLVDDNAADDQRRAALVAKLRGASPAEAEAILKQAPVRTILCLDATTGKPVWQRPLDLTGGIGGMYWSSLGTMVRKGVLVVFGIYSDGHYWKDFFAGQFESRRVVALSTDDGHQLWEKHIGYRVRPLIIEDTLHAEPWAYDLRTGNQKMRINPLSGREEPWQFARPGHHCGCPAASPNCLFFRSYHIAYYDLLKDQGVTHFSTQRPGCWINFIFGNGLVLVPEASSGCMCPFANMSTVVFAPAEQTRSWAKYSVKGKLTPVKHLALNLGAPGDRRDAEGTLWLSFPRPGGPLVTQFKMDAHAWPGGGYFKESQDFISIAGTQAPWLYASGFRGLRRCEIPLAEEGDGTARYTVRLGLADLDNQQPGVRVFDVKLQGQAVEQGFDPVREAGGGKRAVIREFKGIDVENNLVIELTPQAKEPAANQIPLVQTIEIIRERVLTAGLRVPSFLVNDAKPSVSQPVIVTNHKDTPFAGTLQLSAPQGFAVRPQSQPVTVGADGETASIPVTVTVQGGTARGKYEMEVKLVKQDGTAEANGTAQIDYLGNRDRVVVKATEDAYVGASFPQTCRWNNPSVLVDGGNSKIGDESHHVTYLKFPIDVPGKSVSATLRLFNANNPTSNGGNVVLVEESWTPKTLKYATRPTGGKVLGNIGRVDSLATLEVPLKFILDDRKELNLCVEPVNCDGTDYTTKEGGKPAELVIEFER